MKNNIRSHITKAQLTARETIVGPVDNQWFLPAEESTTALHPLLLTLTIPEAVMHCNHEGVEVNNKRVDIFPATQLRLASLEGTLVPLDRDLLRDPGGNSYWDISLSPGQVWSEPDDGNWSRAVLPFQLSNIFENDTHHGLAMFLYNEAEVSDIYYQVTAETKPFLAPEGLLAWNFIAANVESLSPQSADDALQLMAVEMKDQRPLHGLAHFDANNTKSHFQDLASGFGSDSTLTAGIIMNDEIYMLPCRTAVGDYPYPRSMKFGIWSATKTAFCTMACLRLAQYYGEDPRETLVRDLLPEAESVSTWHDITIGDCLNMASGIGTAALNPEPLAIFGDYLLERTQAEGVEGGMESYRHYHDWFLAPSQSEKNIAAISCPGYSWGPGQVARYRDQDLYIAGAAMDAWLKQRRGAEAMIWNVLRDEVFTPAGLHHPIKFHTIEDDPKKAVPLSDAGLLLTMDNIAALGKLLLNDGRMGDLQILDPKLLDEVFNPRRVKGLPTGLHTTDGEIHYHCGTWHLPYVSNNREKFWIPTMRGYGGQLIAILPNDMTVFRFGFDSYETEERYDPLKLIRLADAIQPF